MAVLRVGTLLAPELHHLYEAVARAIGRGLGVEVVFTETGHDEYAAGRLDLAFVCGLAYVEFERTGTALAPVAAPVVSGERYGGLPVYYSDVVVRRGSGITGFEGLRGRTWAFNEPHSQSGFGITRHHLLTLGETGGFFGAVVDAGSHGSSIDMVRSGEADGAAIDSHLFAVVIGDDPGVGEELEVVSTLGPSTIQPLVAATRLGRALLDEITAVVAGLHEHADVGPLLSRMAIERFVPVGPSDYDDIRRMDNACRSAGFLSLG